MTAAPGPTDLDARLVALGQAPAGIDPNDLVDIVRSVLNTMQGDVSLVHVRVRDEIEALFGFIKKTKAEIAALRPEEITAEHLPAATDELEAVVGATEQATNAIFEAVERIEALTPEMSESTAAKVTECATLVYEACSFQDITGQRIAKVVNALQHIETTVHGLLGALGEAADPGARPRAPAPDRPPGDDLMNGPQLPEEAISQDDIDALLESLD